MSGTLHVVATPIGNLEDITLRALRVLKECDVLLCEDTRRTRTLLEHHGIPTPSGGLVSCHEHNEEARAASVLGWLAQGRQVALVSDAGTPAISDPGYRLVRATREAGYSVVPIPGANAAVAALSAAGLPTDRFTFVGFPPKKSGARKTWLAGLGAEAGTLVMYVPARDVPRVLRDLCAVHGPSEVAAYREVTKRFEECVRGPADAVAAAWEAAPKKGEVTLLIDRPAPREWTDEELLARLETESVTEVVAATGVRKRRVYQLDVARKRKG